MNILKAILEHEVFPALGCTEPIAVAYAAGIAAQEIRGGIEELKIKVDPGVYKNGFAVTIPNTGGERGNLIAGVLGALIGKPELKMEILKSVSDVIIGQAKELIHTGKAKISYDTSKTGLYIEVFIKTAHDSVRAVIEDSHMNLVRLEKNNQTLFEKESGENSSADQEYKKVLKNMKISEFIDLAQSIDDQDYDHIKRGIDMNLKVSEAGQKLQKAGYYISDSVKKGYLINDVFSSTKILTTSAADARMSGLNLSVMSSGGSGNQGIIAILIPYNVGRYFKIEETKIVQSIALSLLTNSYIIRFTGDLSPLCVCAIAAGAGAAAAIVYQQYGRDMGKITLAVNNLISNLGGMFCDGAKEGCALKIATATDSAILSAYMAMNDYGTTSMEGFTGKTAEETIYYLSKISKLGMAKVDDTILGIMLEKTL